MVATPHHLASIASLDVLRDGGSAVDAAICAAATLGVVLPHMTGIGGDAFWLVHASGAERPVAIDGSGPSGATVNPDRFAGEAAIPLRGPRAALTVPGAVDSWGVAHRRWGRLPLTRLLEPAIAYARHGAPVSEDLAKWIDDRASVLRDDPGSSSLFLAADAPIAAGSRLEQAALADTLEAIARRGPRHFYEATAASIVRCLDAAGGMLRTDDFAAYRAFEVEPISVRYRNCVAWQAPPPSQGIAGLMILSFLDGIDLAGAGDGSFDYYHALIQAIKWAFRKRDAHLTDPRFHAIPTADLLDPALARAERDRWLADPSLTQDSPPSGDDTVFIATADGEGNAVGLVQSLYFDFGAAVLDPASGVLLQNRGSYFSLDPRHPNVLAPRKRSASTLMTGILYRSGAPYFVHGTQGGEVQAQTNASLVSRVVDFGLDPQRAIEAPRVLYGRSWEDSANQLLVESAVGDDVLGALRARGHPAAVAPWPSPRMGTAQAIRVKSASRAFHEGGADPRGEGIALGW